MMKRQDIINKNKQDKMKKQTMNLIKRINVSAILFSSVIALDEVVSTNQHDLTVVEAKQTPTQFLNLISGYARDVAKNNGLYASVMMAQAALESGWGNSQLASQHNNLFGIKGSFNGKSTVMKTLEDDGTGSYYQIKDGFKVYDNMKQSLEDYAAVITGDNNPNSWRGKYYKGALLVNTSSYKDATAWLTGRYATDTRYGSKLNQVIEQYGLTSYDTVKPGKKNENDINSQPQPQSNDVHRVVAGESVWSISNKYGMSMDHLRRLNNISGNYIYPGQSLKVTGTTDVASQNKETSETRPSQTSKPVTTNPSANASHTVKSGESVWRISQKYGMTISELTQLNNIKNNWIYPGQVLKVSGKSSITEPAVSKNKITQPSPVTTTKPSNPVTSANGTHLVNSGESVWGISRKYGMSMDQLRQLNNISGNNIYPGQVLKISRAAQSNPVNPTPVTNKTVQSSTNGIETPVVVEDTPVSYPAQVTSASSVYTVKAGDNLYRIAINHGISLNQLLSLNGFANSSVAIFPGQTLKVAP